MTSDIENLSADERVVLLFLQNWPGEYISSTEITRRADGKNRCRQDPRWTTPVLAQLVSSNLLETDGHGKYRVMPRIRTVELAGRKRFVAPRMRAILEKHGRKFDLAA